MLRPLAWQRDSEEGQDLSLVPDRPSPQDCGTFVRKHTGWFPSCINFLRQLCHGLCQKVGSRGDKATGSSLCIIVASM